MDSKIRQLNLPPALKKPDTQTLTEDVEHTRYKETATLFFREITLLSLHRPFFTHALLEPPFDLMKSPYTRSVLSAYASASVILENIRILQEHQPQRMKRATIFWTNAFTAAVILGAIAVRAPDCSLAAPALTEYDRAVELFEVARKGLGMQRGLVSLTHNPK
ncbi:hypothetical protein CPB86DRAFT_146095 [Serendipita vermifera]|nr:hypothetical protein CPB86DRAFT_146095 [Serendipita vermifera]